MALNIHVRQHEPRIGEMTVTLGDPWSPTGSISVVVELGYSNEELNENLRKAKRKIAAKLRELASDLDVDCQNPAP